MDYGVISQGFNRKTYEEILSDKFNRARELFGQDVNLSDNSPLGKFIKLNAYDESQLWEMAEEVYNSAYISTATGQSLDNLVAKIGLSRKQPTKSIGSVSFAGDEGTPIDPGTLVETGGENTVRFLTTNETTVTIDSSGTIEVDVISENTGFETVVPANTITVITNPIPGLDSVTNPEGSQGGQDRETDLQLFQRYLDSLRLGGGNTTEAIYANVLSVAGVRAAAVFENDEDIIVNSIPPHSFEVVVLGGIGEDVAQAILDKKPSGIKSYGIDEQYTLTDDSGSEKIIRLSRAIQQNIYVTVDILEKDSSNFPPDGIDQIKDAVINYIGGTNTNGADVLGLSLGENVSYFKLVNTLDIEGLLNANVFVGIDPSPSGTSDIVIQNREVAITDTTKVVVNDV